MPVGIGVRVGRDEEDEVVEDAGAPDLLDGLGGLAETGRRGQLDVEARADRAAEVHGAERLRGEIRLRR